jgi:hypothetical protein
MHASEVMITARLRCAAKSHRDAYPCRRHLAYMSFGGVVAYLEAIRRTERVMGGGRGPDVRYQADGAVRVHAGEEGGGEGSAEIGLGLGCESRGAEETP